MKIVIDIKTDNAAFEDNEEELREILSYTAEQVYGRRSGKLWDRNGNMVGKFKVTGK